MKKAIVVLIPIMFLVIGIISIGIPSSFASATDPVEGTPGSGHSVSYDHWSVLNVVETITPLGGGNWKYSYEFTNTEAASIWHFGVWTTFDAGLATQTTFAGMPASWDADGHPITGIESGYDARNLDPNIIWVSHTWDNPWPHSPAPIQVGAHVLGFSYTANVLDATPKYYFYEIYDWYLEGGKVTALGLTGSLSVIPEVPFGTIMSFLSMFIAFVGFVAVKRFRFRPKFLLR